MQCNTCADWREEYGAVQEERYFSARGVSCHFRYGVCFRQSLVIFAFRLHRCLSLRRSMSSATTDQSRGACNMRNFKVSAPAFSLLCTSQLSSLKHNTHAKWHAKPRRRRRRRCYTSVYTYASYVTPTPNTDSLLRTMSANGEVSARVLSSTSLVSFATELHATSAVASAAFGRTLICALLLAAGRKEGDTLQIEFRGAGPIRGVTAIATGTGNVRGYVGDPRVEVPLREGALNVPAAIGEGVLAVVRNSVYAKAPYTGLVRISSGEVAEDVAHYLAESEQIPSALAAGVDVRDNGVKVAGGFLVQLLPGASEKSAEILERNVRELPPMTEMLKQGLTPKDVVGRLMRDLQPLQVMECTPRYTCNCGASRVRRTVSLLPENEVRQLLVDQGKIEATCEFCGKKYELNAMEVNQILEEKSRK